MLAKIWKKLLLAICIIACLFNIVSKIVNRTSLEVNLKSVQDGVSLTEIFKKDKNTEEINTTDELEKTTNEVVNEEMINTEETTESSQDSVTSTNSITSSNTSSSTSGNQESDFVVIY